MGISYVGLYPGQATGAFGRDVRSLFGTGTGQHPLALYFAVLLTDDVTKRYVQAAYEAKLQVYDKETGGSKPMAPGSIEPTCISDSG